MSKDRFAIRRNKLLHLIKKSDASTLLVTNEKNVTYLTGFKGDSSYLLINQKKTILISDSRYVTQIADECPGMETNSRPRSETIMAATAKLLKKLKISTLGIEGGSVTVAARDALSDACKTTELMTCIGLVEELRMIKDASEIAATREAVMQAEKGFTLMRASITDDQTELQVAHDLEHAMRRFGALRAAFEPIVACGAHSALPHAIPRDVKIAESPFLLIDWGADNADGYKSDLTRVLIRGKVPAKYRKIYDIVLKAQLKAIATIAPGVKCATVDKAARNVIEKAGFGKQFGHGLGHGTGLNIHEAPGMGGTSKETLKPGMIVTVEPGIYLPGFGGVRIEDDVLVTKGGCEVLSSLPKEFDAMMG